MPYHTPLKIISLLLAGALLAACGPISAAQPQEVPTPTPLPPAPALERPTYTVERGAIERVLQVNGRVTPVDLVRLSFRVEGRVEQVNVQRGDLVRAGDVLATLQQDDALDALRQAQDSVAQAQRTLEQARRTQERRVREAEQALRDAQEDLSLLLPGGPNDPIPTARNELEQARREARDQAIKASEAKTQAEYDLLLKTEALQDAQQAYSKAFWDNDWAQRYGTNPEQPYTEDPATGARTPNLLTPRQKEEYQTRLKEAERALRDAERALELSVRALEQVRLAEIEQNALAEEKVAEEQAELDELLAGSGNRDLIRAQRTVQERELALREAREGDFLAEIKSIEEAQRALDKASKRVEDGQIVAPQNGEVLALALRAGDTARAFEPVIEIADPSQLEIGAELSADQMRQLAEGQPAEVSLLTRPDVMMPAVIRRMPAPYGSGGSGAVQEQDRTTRFNVSDTRGQTLTPGAVARITIVLERKTDVLWLPPDAIRSFEGRRFVVVRDGDRERRVTVRVGISTEERVEILEGVDEGDIVVGQ